MSRAVCASARDERVEMADFVSCLTPEQWSTLSLCADWTIRDVVAHTVAYLRQSPAGMLAGMVRAWCDLNVLNESGLTRMADVTSDDLVSLLHDHAVPSGVGRAFGGRVALLECLVHHQDIRRPLGMVRPTPHSRLRIALDFARRSPVVRGAARTRGVRWVATDMEWAAGRGPTVHGTAEAILLAMTGRTAAVATELRGEGWPIS